MNTLTFFLIEFIVLETGSFLYVNYRKKRNAERTIIKKIDALVFDRIIYTKPEIEKSIETLHLNGTFSERKKNQLLCILDNKYTELHNAWVKKVSEDSERDYKAKMKAYYGDNYKS